MKNKKIYLKEQTVNEIQLNDLYSMASKVEQQVISLAEMAVKFSNNEVKNKALSLKSIANDFSTLLSDIITGESDYGIETDNDLESVPNEKENLEDPNASRKERRMESKSVLSTLKRLIESVDSGEEDLFGDENIKGVEKENKKEILLDDETDELDLDEESEDEIDLSPFFSSLTDGLEISKLEELKKELVSIFSDKEGMDNFVKEFESVVDVDTLNFALSNLYDYADENGVTIKTM